MKNSIENLKPKLADGIPELDVPRMEPLVINFVHFQVVFGISANRLTFAYHRLLVNRGSATGRK